MDYKDTLNLPKTDFPMKAGLAEQEPKRIARWERDKLYEKLIASRKGAKKSYVLHDGPPYANGNIHIGTALNKILKDFVVKTKLGAGYYSPYVPGWDCHGLPIEHKVDLDLGAKKATTSKSDIRKLCREYAMHWLDVQRTSFKRLGVHGDWENPYRTMAFDYEATTLRELYRVFKNGSLYKGVKPVHWCPSCVTALAEAEVEYADHTSTSVYVKFPLTKETLSKLGLDKPVSAVIWTTTPWTLPANMGICLNPSEDYAVMRIAESEGGNLQAGELILVAKNMTGEGSNLPKNLLIKSWSEVVAIPAKKLDRLTAQHPFYHDKTSLLMLGEHVLMTDGTGLVHTAPGHGHDDFLIGQQYGLETFNPVDDYGHYKKDLPLFASEDIYAAQVKIIELMRTNGTLIASEKLSHSYPHCWRCKKPVIFRATSQWFISMETTGIRKKTLNAIENEVRWIPTWGQNRIHGMIESRPDWCVSRQRAWGVPIALFTCRDCEKVIFNDDIEKKVLDSFLHTGADAWFEHDAEYYLGKGTKCPHCGSTDIRKESDILDVWFDSGTSHAAVLELRPELKDVKNIMYLEGTDQHRGWFHSSILESIATRDRAPYTEVLTHGFVLDKERRKMSKSAGNFLAPEELVKTYGAEVLRLWVSCADYADDISISRDIMSRLVDSYRKVRNTSRYLLGGLYDFNPDKDLLPFDKMLELDRFILLRWQDTLAKIRKGYEDYQFHVFYHTFMNFCINDLSALYLDIIKDRLYSYAPASRERRSAQSAMFILCKEMAVLMAPVLSFTADEIWEYLPNWQGKCEFVFEDVFADVDRFSDDKLMAQIDKMLTIRKAVNKALELSRADKVIGHPLDAAVLIGVKKEAAVDAPDEGLSRFLIVSKAEMVDFEAVKDGILNDEGTIFVKVSPHDAPKCARCWTRSESVGKNKAHEDLCERCIDVLSQI
ncbi:isoleucine--tRNA ligase [Deferribacterales bacterium RsTz2092]|nr:isoleucine--tRNA ligase [Deferribacterales bacterium]